MRSNPDAALAAASLWSAALLAWMSGCGGENPPAAPLAPEPTLVEPTTLGEPTTLVEPTTLGEPAPVAAVVEPDPSPTLATPPVVSSPSRSMVGLGEGRGCAIGRDHTAYCFSFEGPPPIEDTVATPVPGLTNAVTLVANDYRVCIVDSGGAVSCAASRRTGAVVTFDAAQPVAALPGAQRLALQRDVICASDSAGAVQCVAFATGIATPVALPGPALDLTSSTFETCAALADGVYCWGPTRALHREETRLNGARAVSSSNAANNSATCVLSGLGSEATCYGWIGNWYYEDIEFDDDERGSVNAMEGPVSPGAHLTFAGTTMRDMSTASDHACALSESGGVSCWGAAFRNGRAEGFEPRNVAGWASGVTELAGGGHPYIGVTCAVQAGVLRCFFSPGQLLDAQPGASSFRVCMPGTGGTCEPFRVAAADASSPAVDSAAAVTTDVAPDATRADTEIAGTDTEAPGAHESRSGGCVVHDESGTPLNVRAEASGRAEVVGTLANDTRVRVLEAHGPWRRVDGPPAGWVWNEAIVCE